MLCGSCLSMFRSMYEVGCSVCACVQGILTLCVCSRDSNSVCVCAVCGGGCVHVCLQSFSRWCRYRPAIPNLFGSRAQFCGRQIFHRHGGGDDFRMIQVHYVYCALYFYCYYISSTSENQALDPEDWGLQL